MVKSFVFIVFSIFLAVPSHAHQHPSSHGKQADLAQGSIIGNGDFTFGVNHDWLDKNGAPYIGTTHGDIVFDKQGKLYVSFSDGQFEGIAKFSAQGKFLNKLTGHYPNIHGMLLREENGQEVIYAVSNSEGQLWKMDLTGKPLLTISKPQIIADTNLYKPNKDGNIRVALTSVTVAPTGDIFIADGYSSNFIHIYSKTGVYKKSFGGWGQAIGKFHQAHDISIDTRFDKPYLIICNRANNRIEHYDFDGNFVRVISDNLRMPGKIAFWGDYLAVAELKGRVTILDKSHAVYTHLGANESEQKGNFNVTPDKWLSGVFTAPHTAKFDSKGNLYVMDWNKFGRITQLRKLKQQN